jgi:hypothetical protein
MPRHMHVGTESEAEENALARQRSEAQQIFECQFTRKYAWTAGKRVRDSVCWSSKPVHLSAQTQLMVGHLTWFLS